MCRCVCVCVYVFVCVRVCIPYLGIYIVIQDAHSTHRDTCIRTDTHAYTHIQMYINLRLHWSSFSHRSILYGLSLPLSLSFSLSVLLCPEEARKQASFFP